MRAYQALGVEDGAFREQGGNLYVFKSGRWSRVTAEERVAASKPEAVFDQPSGVSRFDSCSPDGQLVSVQDGRSGSTTPAIERLCLGGKSVVLGPEKLVPVKERIFGMFSGSAPRYVSTGTLCKQSAVAANAPLTLVPECHKYAASLADNAFLYRDPLKDWYVSKMSQGVDFPGGSGGPGGPGADPSSSKTLLIAGLVGLALLGAVLWKKKAS